MADKPLTDGQQAFLISNAKRRQFFGEDGITRSLSDLFNPVREFNARSTKRTEDVQKARVIAKRLGGSPTDYLGPDLNQTYQLAISGQANNPVQGPEAAPSNFDGLSFDKAFAAARKQGLSQFDWKGKPFTTNLAPSAATDPNNLSIADARTATSASPGTAPTALTPSQPGFDTQGQRGLTPEQAAAQDAQSLQGIYAQATQQAPAAPQRGNVGYSGRPQIGAGTSHNFGSRQNYAPVYQAAVRGLAESGPVLQQMQQEAPDTSRIRAWAANPANRNDPRYAQVIAKLGGL